MAKRAKNAAMPDAQAPLATETEARQLAALLQRAYPPLKEPRKKSGAGGGGAEPASSGKSGLGASVAKGKTATLLVEIEATPTQLKQLRTWLTRISIVQRSQHANNTKRMSASGVPRGAEKRQRYRIALHFPKKK